MNSLQAVVGVFVCSLAFAACTTFTDCGSKEATINSLKVPGCDSPPCVFKKGTNVSFEMDFTANQDISEVTTKITAYLGPVPVPFNPPDTNSCHFMKCPITKGTKDVYSQALPVLSSYPSLSVKVQWQLTDTKTGNAVTCFQIEASIQ